MTISSHVAVGAVGNRAIVFALEALGLRAGAVHTVQLPFHPGHGPSRRIALAVGALREMLDELAENRDIDAPAAVLTGYFADHRQVATVADFLAQQKSQRPDLKIVCDPVIGDATGLYVAPKTAAAIRDDLVAIADVATPNRHELAWLTRAAPARDLAEAEDQARRLGPATVLVTSAPIAEEARRAESTANLLVTAQASWVVEHRLVRGPKNGPGDLTAGLFCGHLALRRSPRDALVRTTASVLGLMRRSEPSGDAEMALAGNQAEIVTPRARLSAVRLRRARA